MRPLSFAFLFLLPFLATVRAQAAAPIAAPAAISPADLQFFENKIRPVLV
ncbi:MAG: hypothetical protein NTZ29_15635 [Verrucomicrobia bacterium]|nr:hypothetical protein [Verrucomicrobiota bacterium]